MTQVIARMHLNNDSKDEIESDSDNDEDLDSYFYSVEDMLNAQVFDTPNQDIYNVKKLITMVQIEMILPFGKLTRFDHKVHEKRKKKCFNNTSTR